MAGPSGLGVPRIPAPVHVQNFNALQGETNKGSAQSNNVYPAANVTANGFTQINEYASYANNPDANTGGAGSESGFVPATNPNYWITLTKKTSQGNMVVRANAPADFDFSIKNDFTSLMTALQQSGGISSAIGAVSGSYGSTIGMYRMLTGNFQQPKIASFQIWTGTEPLTFALPLHFHADSDPYREVMNPVRTLIAMAAAEDESGTGMLNAPGPTLKDYAQMQGGYAATALSALYKGWRTNDPGSNMQQASQASGFINRMSGLNNSTTLQFGRHLIIPGLIIEDVRIKQATRSTETGLIISAEAQVSVKTVMSMSRSDIMECIYGKAGSFQLTR